MRKVLIRVHPYKENIVDSLYENVKDPDSIIQVEEVMAPSQFDSTVSYFILNVSPFLTFELIEGNARRVIRSITDVRNFLSHND